MVTKDKKIKKGSSPSKFLPILLGCLIFIIVGYLVYSDLKINSRRAELNTQLRTLQQELQELEARRQQLQTQISQTMSEEYLEKEARETFNLKKPGEEVVTVLPPENEQEARPEESLWGKIMDKIRFW